ncbi:putative leucine-rich repeat domain superfamily [Helianthus debilis subsp. tardiflorus]
MREGQGETFANDEEVLEGLEPNPRLKGLEMYNYMGTVISPSWMVNLENLVEIRFFRCKKCEHIPTLGRLPNLRVIHLLFMHSLKYFYDDDNNMSEDTTNMFLCLQELNIVTCPNLVSLPGKLPKLKVLRLNECNELVSLPNEMQSFKDMNLLVILGCPKLSERCEKDIGIEWPKISHIPNIRTDLMAL